MRNSRELERPNLALPNVRAAVTEGAIGTVVADPTDRFQFSGKFRLRVSRNRTF